MNMNIILSSGKCSIEDGSRVCTCTGNYYGTQCQLDGEVMLAYFFVMFIVLLFGGSACTADNGVGDPITEHLHITVLCKYLNKSVTA